jgi:large subunit ribosomal protein L21
MYAIVEIAGQQFKVEKDQQLFVHRLEGKEGSKVDFDQVLLIDNNGKINVGAPAVSGAMVSAKIIEHLKGDKVIVFKKKRRKGYKVRNGHRQYLTKIQIENIAEKGATKKVVAEKAATPKETPKAEVKEAAPKKAAAKPAAAKTTTAVKKAPAKKATETKAKAAAPKKTATTASKTTKAAPKKKDDK